MEPFEENVARYEKMHEKEKNLIYKKIQIAKMKMKKTSKNKRMEKCKKNKSNV